MVGIGGMGHLAVQIAAKRGCVVTAISSKSDKEEAARELGASHFLLDTNVPKAEAGSLDFILFCSRKVDTSILNRLLAPEGTACFVPGSAAAAVELDMRRMARKGQKVVTAAGGGRRDMDAFMRFATAQGVRACVETTPISEVNEGIAMLRRNEAQFCVVIES